MKNLINDVTTKLLCAATVHGTCYVIVWYALNTILHNQPHALQGFRVAGNRDVEILSSVSILTSTRISYN